MALEIIVTRATRAAIAVAVFALVATAFAPRTARADDLPGADPTPVPTLLPLDQTPPPLIYPAVPTPVPAIVPATEAPSPVPQTPAPLTTARPHARFHASPPPAWPGATTPAPASPAPAPPAASPQPAKLIPAKPAVKPPAIKAPAIKPPPVVKPPAITQPAASSPNRGGPGRVLYAPLRYFVNTKWSCETFGGANETNYYVSKGPYAFTLHSILRSPSGGGIELQETYAFDWAHHTWKLAMGRGAYSLRAVRLGDNDWIFEGTHLEKGVSQPFRMRYHMYDDVIMRRDFETLHAGTWLPFAGETCERNDFADVKM